MPRTKSEKIAAAKKRHGPNMSIKKDQPKRKASYCARSGGIKGKSSKLSANYWSRKAWDC